MALVFWCDGWNRIFTEMHWTLVIFRSSRIPQPWCNSYWQRQDNSPWEHTSMRQSVCTHTVYTHTHLCFYSYLRTQVCICEYTLALLNPVLTGTSVPLIKENLVCASVQKSSIYIVWDKHDADVCMCVSLQSESWSRGQRRKWKQQRREPARRSQSWKTN